MQESRRGHYMQKTRTVSVNLAAFLPWMMCMKIRAGAYQEPFWAGEEGTALAACALPALSGARGGWPPLPWHCPQASLHSR